MSSLFDRAALMERIGNDEDVLRELIDMFVDLQPPRMNELALAVASEDSDLTRSCAHTRAGAFRSVSMPLLGDLSKSIELAAAREAMPECQKLFQELDATFASLMNELRGVREGWGSEAPADDAKVPA